MIVVVVVRTRSQAIPLTMITKRKSIHGFPLLTYIGMGLRLAAIRAAGAPSKSISRLRRVPIERLWFLLCFGAYFLHV